MDFIKSVFVWFIAVCFLVILFPITFFIWLLVLPFDPNRNVTHRLIIYQSIVLSQILPIWKIHVDGIEKIDRKQTYVFIANHQSILDILLLNNLRCDYKWISKIENLKMPILGWYLWMADYITVNRGNEESKVVMLDKSLKCLKAGISIMIFPEGTRSVDRNLGFFKRGAFQLASQAHVPLLPILIDGTTDILPKHGLVLGSGYEIHIRVLDPVLPESFKNTDPDKIAADVNKLMTEELKKLRGEKRQE
jgi:1-acyl-sn-glycerol-3-phosphate acyltransferase